MILAKLTGEADGYVVSRAFADEGSAIQWLQDAGLSEFNDQTARGEVSSGGKIIWTKSSLQTRECQERNEKREAQRFLARLNLTDKGGRL